MKILFISPVSLHRISIGLPEVVSKKTDIIPNLGLMYIAAYLEKYSNHVVKILDCLAEDINDLEGVKARIMAERPDAVGLTVTTYTLIDAIETARMIKETDPSIKIIFGGPHVNIYPEETISIQVVDYLVLGEGEEATKDLLDNMKNHDALYEIKGIVFKDKDGKAVNTGTRELIYDLDSLPFPARHLTKWENYCSSLSSQSPVTTMFTSRGCPYKCIFCDRPHLGKVFRARSAKNVVDEMEECHKMSIKEIFIYGDTFGVDRQRVLDICAEIKKRGLLISWDVRTRVNTVDEEIIKAMKEAGCRRIHYGVEAGTQRMLNVLQKGITLEMAEKAFAITKKYGIQVLGYFMIGSPTETKKEILATIKFAKKLNPDFALFSILVPYPETKVYLDGLREKKIPYDKWREFAKKPTTDFTPFLWEENLSKPELIALLRKAYKSFYFRPRYIIRRLLQLSSFSDFKKKFSAGLNILRF